MDLNYLFHRQQVERTRAAGATSKEARVVHEQLARCYETQIRLATDGRLYAQSPSSSGDIDNKRSKENL